MSDLRNAAVTPEEAHTETDAPRARRVGYKGASQHTGLPVGTLKQKVHRRAIPHLRLGPRLTMPGRSKISSCSTWA